MSLAPKSKKRRVDPDGLNDDDILPGKGQSILGKRKRNDKNSILYNNDDATTIQKGVNQNYPKNSQQFDEQKNIDNNNNSNNNNNNNNNDMNISNNDMNINNNKLNEIISFKKGHTIDVKITDEHNDTFWTTGAICSIKDDKILLHIPRHGSEWITKDSQRIAPNGTYTDT